MIRSKKFFIKKYTSADSKTIKTLYVEARKLNIVVNHPTYLIIPDGNSYFLVLHKKTTIFPISIEEKKLWSQPKVRTNHASYAMACTCFGKAIK